MIDLANAEKTESNIKYLHADVIQLDPFGPFDLITACYLLNYSSSREDLLNFCRVLFANLKPGGRFVAINDSSIDPPMDKDTYKKYGFFKEFASGSRPSRLYEPITYHLVVEDRDPTFQNFFITPSEYEVALTTAGFVDIVWHRCELAPAAEAIRPCEFYQDLLAHPTMQFFSCIRPLD
eukprot:GILK01008361.1.p1 GENE.GILK01008361.1~~GILK01008361.1.p1  ORF type:complete len:179 (+),score=15.87 GILK01008361.1:283-819(+)